MDYRLERSFIKTKNHPRILIFSKALHRLERKYSPQEITAIINQASYKRYFGNFGNVILKIVFQPHILFTKPKQHWYVSPTQAADALHTMFTLITKYDLKHDVRDYYGYTMAQSVFSIIDPAAPPHIVKIAHSFVYLLKRGPNVVCQQQHFVKAWLERRRRAVRTIENWWLEILHSPYNEIGNRNIEKMAVAWREKYL